MSGVVAAITLDSPNVTRVPFPPLVRPVWANSAVSRLVKTARLSAGFCSSLCLLLHVCSDRSVSGRGDAFQGTSGLWVMGMFSHGLCYCILLCFTNSSTAGAVRGKKGTESAEKCISVSSCGPNAANYRRETHNGAGVKAPPKSHELKDIETESLNFHQRAEMH